VTKATLHDELMREAGFESEYHVGLARRREEKRRKLKVDLLRAVRVAAVIAVLLGTIVPLLDIFSRSNDVPRAPFVVVIAAILVGCAADLRLDRTRGEDEPSGLLRRALWRFGRSVSRARKRVAHGRESNA
jgi:hypothetical protein